MEKEHGVVKPAYIAAFTADVSETSTRELINGGCNCVLPKPTPAGALEELCRTRILAGK